MAERVFVGEIFQTARETDSQPGKQIVRLSRANRISVVRVGALAEAEKYSWIKLERNSQTGRYGNFSRETFFFFDKET